MKIDCLFKDIFINKDIKLHSIIILNVVIAKKVSIEEFIKFKINLNLNKQN